MEGTRRWRAGPLACALAVACAAGRSSAGPSDPPGIDLAAIVRQHAPPGWEIASAVFARGVQSYAPVSGAWYPKGATADLFALEATMKPKAERSGALFPGLQGLTWDFGGGRRVLDGAEAIPGATGDGAPWLRIATRHLTDLYSTGGWSYVLQVHTTGGKPPSTAPAADAESWVAAPFTAYYVFLQP
jgi:hypothetical protein